MRCKKGHEVRAWDRFCPVCLLDCGFPNVRAALGDAEHGALQQRYDGAVEASASHSCDAALHEFHDALLSSKAVICRSVSQVQALVESENALYASFYQLVSAGARRPDDSEADLEREVADSILFPYYKEHIRFAALSLDGVGVRGSFGVCSLVLDDSSIEDRATVFEENSLTFCRNRALGVGRRVPPGYRATWTERGKLAAAKLHGELRPGMSSSTFASLLLAPPLSARAGDFVEVHIYGSIHRDGVERVIVDDGAASDDAVLKKLETSVKALGIAYGSDRALT